MYCIIFNPTAGAGRSVRIMQAVEQRLKEKNVSYTVFETQYRQHAVSLAQDAVGKGYDGILSVGGDGTLLEVASALQGTQESLGVIPAGTGNDFRQAIGVPRDPLEALDVVLSGTRKSVDIGLLGEDRFFLNVAGTGFDVEVIKNTERVRRMFTGGFAYFLGIFFSVFNYKSVTLDVTIDGRTIRRSVLLIAIANGKCYGGGLNVAPHADVSDGLFNIVLINSIPNWRILVELPKMKKGQIDKIPGCEQFSCRELFISSDQPQRFNLDGEVYGETPVQLSVQPRSINVFVPDNPSL